MIKKEFKYPLRVGRKQKRAILDSEGVEVGLFSTGSEKVAQKFCDWMNREHQNDQIKSVSPSWHLMDEVGKFPVHVIPNISGLGKTSTTNYIKNYIAGIDPYETPKETFWIKFSKKMKNLFKRKQGKTGV